MQSSDLTCPFCNSTLNFGTTIVAGSPVECLICMQTFVAETTFVAAVRCDAARAPESAPPVRVALDEAELEPVGVPMAVPAASIPVDAEPERVDVPMEMCAESAPSAGIAVGILEAKPKRVAVAETLTDASVTEASPVPSPKKTPTRPAPKRRPAQTSGTGGRLLLIAVVAGLLLLLAGGGGIAVWKIASSANTDGADPQVALNNPADDPNNTTLLAKTVAGPTPAGNPDDEEERERALDAARTVLVRKNPVQVVGKDPELDPIAAIDVRARHPFGLDQNKIDLAIAKGVFYLKKNQNANGTWAVGHGVGHASIGGLTLLECGAPANDFFVQRSAAHVRHNVQNLNQTYELSLAILFLDRLGDPRDRAMIQGLSLRLLGGQLDGGGWTYYCPLLDSQEMFQLYAFLQTNKPSLQNPLGMNAKLPTGVGSGTPPLGNPIALNPPLLNPLAKSMPTKFGQNPIAWSEIGFLLNETSLGRHATIKRPQDQRSQYLRYGEVAWG